MDNDTPLRIVSASRTAVAAFADGTPLGRSLRLSAHQPSAARICTGNREPLGAIDNQALEALQPDSLVVFCHDDVWLGEACLRTPLLEALERFDLVVTIRHGDPGASEPIRFGPSPAPAHLLDGVRFDPAFPFHF
jgi:hypothetical protein